MVHDYGDLCQSITDLAFERKVPFATDEFRTLNRCLDNAIAEAVSEFTYLRDLDVAEKEADALNERLGFFAHELRNLLNSATLALTAIKSGDVGLNGATGAVLERSLMGLRTHIDRSLADVRITAGLPIPSQLFSLADFIADVKHTTALEAEVKDCNLRVAAVDPNLALNADRDLISSAVTNLLQNAFKFTHARSSVRLNAYATSDRIRIDVEDQCGGLPARGCRPDVPALRAQRARYEWPRLRARSFSSDGGVVWRHPDRPEPPCHWLRLHREPPAVCAALIRQLGQLEEGGRHAMNLPYAYALLLVASKQAGALKLTGREADAEVRQMAAAGLVDATVNDGRTDSVTSIIRILPGGASFLRTFNDHPPVTAPLLRGAAANPN